VDNFSHDLVLSFVPCEIATRMPAHILVIDIPAHHLSSFCNFEQDFVTFSL